VIKDIPNAKDFFDSGIELFDFAWDIVAELITNLFVAEREFEVDVKDVSEEYWAASKRRLTTALAMTQQGVEFIMKGKIAEISPYLLLAESALRWPSPYDGHELTFSEFKMVDAQDLVRIHDTVQDRPLPSDFVDRSNAMRTKRNRIAHSIDKELQVHTTEVIETILFFYKALFPEENWAKTRATFIRNYPDATLSGGEYSTNDVCRELESVLALLPPAAVETYFGISKKQYLYLCPTCLADGGHHVDFDHKLAALRPKGPTSTTLYCPVCDREYAVARRDCDQEGCPGNVLAADEEPRCLTCGRWQETEL